MLFSSMLLYFVLAASAAAAPLPGQVVSGLSSEESWTPLAQAKYLLGDWMRGSVPDELVSKSLLLLFCSCKSHIIDRKIVENRRVFTLRNRPDASYIL